MVPVDIKNIWLEIRENSIGDKDELIRGHDDFAAMPDDVKKIFKQRLEETA